MRVCMDRAVDDSGHPHASQLPQRRSACVAALRMTNRHITRTPPRRQRTAPLPPPRRAPRRACGRQAAGGTPSAARRPRPPGTPCTPPWSPAARAAPAGTRPSTAPTPPPRAAPCFAGRGGQAAPSLRRTGRETRAARPAALRGRRRCVRPRPQWWPPGQRGRRRRAPASRCCARTAASESDTRPRRTAAASERWRRTQPAAGAAARTMSQRQRSATWTRPASQSPERSRRASSIQTPSTATPRRSRAPRTRRRAPSCGCGRGASRRWKRGAGALGARRVRRHAPPCAGPRTAQTTTTATEARGGRPLPPERRPRGRGGSRSPHRSALPRPRRVARASAAPPHGDPARRA
mmetsp:Transcript_6130/g.21775  ORF Transcript_6130/g.21775 Transcript_6130/m.21775 type:complete len:350 (-) Transcript_6130:315-1364(-)